ncbi:acyl- desaturase [Moniliophthora roreri MCA 2997]|uniref:Acyl-CoA desaturase n=1 Tax=Moniliophthora roreri (strain MCA 2997) TaxID=1381753 RepID=V2Y5M0_MONRO|nr:acyl- desaturase [Moniliophthora roreri MCA 2997]
MSKTTSSGSPAVAANNSKPATRIWWSNAIFFVVVHLAAAIGIYFYPPSGVPRETLVLALVSWQLAELGITIGYHRLYSHRAFRASLGVRIVLSALGSAGFQGSIKWWCLRHRLHHRFTDDPVHDPYAATRGLLHSHVGWIFFKPTYEKMELVDRQDLDNDPVVRFQHKNYIPLALFFGLVLPSLVGILWGDPVGACVWGGLVARVAVWHCTFLVNSLAHWDGLQPYSDENTSRGNLLLAILTSGEGSHNFHHAFPHDYRSGPSLTSWDPSKWIILLLHRLGLITGLRRAREADMKEALVYMSHKAAHGVPPKEDEDQALSEWTIDDAIDHLQSNPSRCLVSISGYVVDITGYLGEHPGGSMLLRRYSLQLEVGAERYKWPDATWAFEGGLNNHSRAATRRMKEFRLARLSNQ